MSDWRTALSSLVRELRDLYGARLHEVLLYGSRARGDADPDSDIDTLIVLSPMGRFWEEFDRISQVASRLSLEHDVVISALPVDVDDLRAHRTPFLLNVRREGTRAA